MVGDLEVHLEAVVHSVGQVAVDRNAEVGHLHLVGPFVVEAVGDKRLTSSSTSSITDSKRALGTNRLTNILSLSIRR